MLEYRNGEFSENMDLESAMEKFQNALTEDPFTFKALHVGTEDELNEIRRGSVYPPEEEKGEDLQSQIDDLKAAVEDLKPVKSSLIHIPTDQERKALQDITDAGKDKETSFLFD